MGNIYFTSDTHYGHKNIITYCARPFRDVEDMTEQMVNNWNAIVQPDDLVYHLGDFSMGLQANAAEAVRQRLRGQIILVRGNHDRSACLRGFSTVMPHGKLRLAGRNLYLRHIPVEYGEPLPPGTDVHLCGHVHEKWKVKEWGGRPPIINVGVDVWGYKPVTIHQLLSALGR